MLLQIWNWLIENMPELAALFLIVKTRTEWMIFLEKKGIIESREEKKAKLKAKWMQKMWGIKK